LKTEGRKNTYCFNIDRKRAPLFMAIGSLLIIPWLMPQIYPMVLEIQWLFVLSFLSEFLGGFMIGYIVPSLKFTEKLLLFSLGFAGDTIYLLLLYLASGIFHVPSQLLLNSVIVLVYGIKFPEGVVFAVYIMKKIGGI